jgi:membrane-anchored glycerophosphoryl diester phosphodiesterase (GDPDase)
MTTTQNTIFTELTYTNEIKEQIVLSGGTIIFIKDNVIMASEISEAEYRELLNNPYIDKLDVLPLKRYGYDSITYNNMINESHWIY